MNKKVLILSSNFTGHGHKSITESLCEQFAKHAGVSVEVVDGFTLGGNLWEKVGKSYGSVTRNAKELWKLAWDMSVKKPSIINEIVEIAIKENLLGLLARVKPDVILSVHPNFNGSVINILDEHKIEIPFLTLIADLVSIASLWSDPRADYIICPTYESMQKSVDYGVEQNRLKVIGFPVRSKFCRHMESNDADNFYHGDRPLECLIMSGGEGSGNMSRVANILLKNFNCKVKIIAGRNLTLKKRLESTLLEKYPDRLEVHGFLENIQDFMLTSDIAFTRGSPNTMMEAVMCNVPLIITGNLPGQEEGNPEYLEKHNLGVVCKDLTKLKSVISELIEGDAKKLNQIKKAQRMFRNPDIASDIVKFVLEAGKNPNIQAPKASIETKTLRMKLVSIKKKKNL